MRRFTPHHLCALALLVALSLSGCGRVAPTGPANHDAAALARAAGSESARAADRSFLYPLALGNRWVYTRNASFVLIPDGGPPGAPEEYRSTIENVLVCAESFNGRDYLVERDVETETGPSQSFTSWIYMRQDETGLYEADRNISEAPTCGAPEAGIAVAAPQDPALGAGARALAAVTGPRRAAWAAALEALRARRATLLAALAPHASASGLEAVGELTRLRYPLHPAATWLIREDPRVVARAEALQTLNLPAGRFSGYRIRIEWPGVFGPRDRVHVWYGPDGFLKMELRVEADAVDENGTLIGTIVSQEVQELESISLSGR